MTFAHGSHVAGEPFKLMTGLNVSRRGGVLGLNDRRGGACGSFLASRRQTST
jgi:hypothetical protein